MSARTSSGLKNSDVEAWLASAGRTPRLARWCSNLDKRGVPVPPEFATTADVYWCYIDASGLKQTITTALTDFVSFLMPGDESLPDRASCRNVAVDHWRAS